MANITPYVSKILSAIYGREVRGSIADALTAMNSDINIDLAVVKASEEAAKSSATLAGTYATNANNSASAANTSANLSKTSETKAKASEDEANRLLGLIIDYESSAKSSAIEAKGYSETAGSEKNEANRYRILAQNAAQIAQDLLSFTNYEKIYEFIRSKIIQDEGFEVSRSLEDSDNEAILDSSGNPILGREYLDPLNFPDMLEYVLIKIDEHSEFWEKVYNYVHANLDFNEIFIYVLDRLLMNASISQVFDKVFERILKEENIQTIFDLIYQIFRSKIIQDEGFEVSRSLEDSDNEAILDSSGNPILGREYLDPLNFPDMLEYVQLKQSA